MPWPKGRLSNLFREALIEKYPKVRLRLSTELTGELIHRLLTPVNSTVAAVLLPDGKTAPPPLLTNIIARDRMEIVQGAAGNVDGDWKSLGRAPWVLQSVPGAFFGRASSVGWSVPASPRRLRLKSTTCTCSWRSFSPVMA